MGVTFPRIEIRPVALAATAVVGVLVAWNLSRMLLDDSFQIHMSSAGGEDDLTKAANDNTVASLEAVCENVDPNFVVNAPEDNPIPSDRTMLLQARERVLALQERIEELKEGICDAKRTGSRAVFMNLINEYRGEIRMLRYAFTK